MPYIHQKYEYIYIVYHLRIILFWNLDNGRMSSVEPVDPARSSSTTMRNKQQIFFYRTYLISSVLFLVGSILLSVAAVIMYGDGSVYGFDTGIMGMAGLVGWLMHVVVELYIDVFFVVERQWMHSRFGRKRSINIANSLMFGIASILEMYAIVSSKKIFHLLAAGALVVSAALTCGGRGCDVKGENFNNAGNIIFMIASSVMFLFGFLQVIMCGGFSELECLHAFDAFFFALSIMLFVIVGALFVLSDCFTKDIANTVVSDHPTEQSSQEQRHQYEDVIPVLDIDYGEHIIVVDDVDFIEDVIVLENAYMQDENAPVDATTLRVDNAMPSM